MILLQKKTKPTGLSKTAAALVIIAAAFLKSASFSPVTSAPSAPNVQESESVIVIEDNALPAQNDEFIPKESFLYTPEQDKNEPVYTDVSAFKKEDIKVLNNTALNLDYWSLLNEELNFKSAEANSPSVLIIHTHASEAYTPSEKYTYEPTDPSRTEDTNYNMIRVGEEIAAGLVSVGIGVYHETELFDYPTYNGSYTRALERINELLELYPTIQIILDIHRDSLVLADGTEYAKVCRINDEDAAEILLVVGSDEGQLSHPNWKENLKFALQLERIMEVKYDDLLRNLNLRKERFNQHATIGSLIIEVGCAGNTLEQALCAARAFSDCAGEIILQALS